MFDDSPKCDPALTTGNPQRRADPSREDIANAVRVLAIPGGVVELRALAEDGTHSGYFDDPDRLATAAELLDLPSVHGIYITFNEVSLALLARRANRVKMRLTRTDPTTSDADIIRRRWFPVDIDPVRPGGVSATDQEHEHAKEKSTIVASWLSEQGFPEPVRGDSGNGAHLLYRIDLPNDDGSRGLVQQCLATLSALFSDGTSTIDIAVSNASRIWKLYGTVSRKGDHTASRPHRRSYIVSVPDEIGIVPKETLVRLATLIPASHEHDPATRDPSTTGIPSPAGRHFRESPGRPRTRVYPDGSAPIDLRGWLLEHGIRIRSEKPWQGGRLFLLDECPFSTAHQDGAFAIQFPTGAVYAGCHHASCGGGTQRWQELRAMHEKENKNRDSRDRRGEGGEKAAAPEIAPERTFPSEEYAATSAVSMKRKSPHEEYTATPGFANERKSPPEEYASTDAGNAERLIAQFGDDIRYCPTAASWYLWNGKVWEQDSSNRIILIATRVARSIYQEVLSAATPDRARALAKWAIASESLRVRKAMIESAAPYAAIAEHEFDARENLLNCQNGTLELDTMTFREHRKCDLLTRMTGVSFDPDADCPRWKAHLSLIFGDDQDYIMGFQSMCGYTLLSSNPEQVLFILFGKGKNGKSKTIEVLARIMGGYAVNIAAETLMVHRYEGVRSDLARIAGARMATASEGEDGARLAESIVKQLTGEYAITVRRLYENEFEFTPTAKIWLTTNHEPVIRGTDDGIWRRIWMVPFAVQIPEAQRDPEIEKALLAEGPGILNWCLQGLTAYYASGKRLAKPGRVSVATGTYRTISDTIAYFLATECTLDPDGMISRLALREHFEKWCEEEGIRRPISARKFAVALKSHGIRNGTKYAGERFWTGIRWKNEHEQELAEQTQDFQHSILGFGRG